MKVSFSKQFVKQFDGINDSVAKVAIRIVIEKIIASPSLREIPNLKKLKGHRSAYRVRTGNYRIGFYLEQNEIFISAVAHRKDIYRSFP